jgi:chromosome segregation ATPase
VQINTQRIAEVETSLESELDASLDRLEALDARLAGVETELAAAVETLESVQADLQGLQDSLGADQGDVQRVRDLETQLEGLASELEAAQARLASVEESVEESRPPVEALNERIQLLRAMELVLRSRLALADNNLGLAGQDLRRARGILAGASAPQDWAPIVDRLDMALANLNSAPLVAVQDVEAAWYLMLEASAP